MSQVLVKVRDQKLSGGMGWGAGCILSVVCVCANVCVSGLLQTSSLWIQSQHCFNYIGSSVCGVVPSLPWFRKKNRHPQSVI